MTLISSSFRFLLLATEASERINHGGRTSPDQLHHGIASSCVIILSWIPVRTDQVFVRSRKATEGYPTAKNSTLRLLAIP
jgi:hypothetical protein